MKCLTIVAASDVAQATEKKAHTKSMPNNMKSIWDKVIKLRSI